MGFLSNAIAASPARRAVAFEEPIWEELLSAFKSKAGVAVNAKTALQVMAVFGCVRVISEDVAQVSRGLLKKRDDSGSDPVTDHPVARLFGRRPNQWQTPFEFLETVVIHTALAGRFVAFRNKVRQETRELLPIEPGRCEIVCNELGVLTYRLHGRDGTYREVGAGDVWHVKGPSWNGWDGMEVLKLAAQAIGLSIATEESHSLMHANGGQTQGIYSVEGQLGDKQYEQLRKWIEKNVSGPNRFRPFILDRGAKFLQTAMKGVDAEHIATRKFQIEEVCRAFRVMPIMIGFSDKTATFASSEQMFDAHVKFTLGGWFRRLEESINTNLLSDDDWQKGVYFKFRPISLLRANAKDRGDFYWKLWQMGAINPNQIRGLEDMNPYDGGDVYRVPVNTAPTDADPNADPSTDPSQDPGSDPHLMPGRLNVGRVLSAKNEQRIRDAGGLLSDVLAELDPTEE